MKRLYVFEILLILAILVVGCEIDPEPVQTVPDFSGTISEVILLDNQDAYGQILVENQVDDYIDKYILTINNDTQLYEKIGSDLQSVGFNFLEVGQQVETWFSGPIMESYPMQATASQVVIIE